MPVKVSLAAVPAGRGARGTLAAGLASSWVVVGLLLLACGAKGVWDTFGVVVPPDPDTVRDLGFIQGLLDGNWLGDPAIAGAWRWYPPLLHGLAAAVVGGLHLPLLPFWLHAGAVLNLLTPLGFYLMNRRLIGAWPGAAATAVLVLFDSVVLPGDATVGYTPWTLTPGLTWPLFFSSVWLIAERVDRLRAMDAGLIGSALGVVFLAHTVPAVLLSGVTACAAVAACGWRWRTLWWLAAVAVIEMIWAAPLLLPLLLAYQLHIANAGPGGWVHPALRDPATLLPNLVGLLALGWLVWRREWLRLPRVTVAILGGWIAVCAIFLARHYACGMAGASGGVCGVFVVAAHHYHVYLQAAWATLGGLALARLWQMGPRHVLLPLAVLAGGFGLVGLFGKAEDLEARRLGSFRAELILDQAAYDWILTWTNPGDLFVTELPQGGVDMGAAAASVTAAGRRLAAPPEYHTNPYVAWPPMDARRVGYLAAAASAGGGLCALTREAGDGSAFFMLPSGRTVHGLVAVFVGRFHSIYRVPDGVCLGVLNEAAAARARAAVVTATEVVKN